MKAAEKFEAIRSDPVGTCRTRLGFDPWSKQREILEAVRDHDRVAVRSANGTGKTSVSGRGLALWWLAGGPGSIVITTAPTNRQVTRQLWQQIRRGVRASSGLFGRAALTETRLELAEDWFGIGLSTDEPESFQGWHGDRVLVIVDEASGVGEVIFEAIEGVLAGGVAKVVLLGNPTRSTGQFHRAFHAERDQWHTIAISAFDTPAFTGEAVPAEVLRGLVTPRWVEDRRKAWSESSPLWQVRVLGDFSTVADDNVVGLADLEAAQARVVAAGSPVVIGVDVARFGADRTCIAVRRGRRVHVARAYVGHDLMHTAGEVARVARQAALESNERPRIVVDDVGVGGGVTDRLRELGEFQVVAFNGGAAAFRPDEYPNRRSEAWFVLAEQLGEIALEKGDEELAADLLAPTYDVDSRGRRVVEAKSVTKRKLGRSPDRADAVILTFAVPDVALRASLAPALPITGGLDRALGSRGLAEDMRDLMTRKW